MGKKDRKNPLEANNEDALISVKRMKVSLVSDYAEDQFSINSHIKALQEECLKRKPDCLIEDKMMRTFKYRIAYVSTHSVAETFTCFPPLRQANKLLNEAKRLGISMATLKEFLITRKSDIMELILKRKPINKRLSELLTSQAECVCTEDSELSFQFLALPCLMQEVPLLFVEECTEISVLQPIVVYRCHRNVLMNSYYELYLDRQLITTAEDL
ncbi:unnamed protein product, partial [Larinioides sclopetarius]